MKLALIGKNISHSKSPSIYKKLLGSAVQYTLLDYPDHRSIPNVKSLLDQYEGISITSPYKAHFVKDVLIEDPLVLKLGVINTLKKVGENIIGTNTDLVAIRLILKSLAAKFSKIHLIILGDGAMAQMTVAVAVENGFSFSQVSRKTNRDLSYLDLSSFEKALDQNVVINACSRDFIFQGQQSSSNIFWDYNYSFLPHQNTLPFHIIEYHDGQEMLYLQAVAAIEFWDLNKH